MRLLSEEKTGLRLSQAFPFSRFSPCFVITFYSFLTLWGLAVSNKDNPEIQAGWGGFLFSVGEVMVRSQLCSRCQIPLPHKAVWCSLLVWPDGCCRCPKHCQQLQEHCNTLYQDASVRSGVVSMFHAKVEGLSCLSVRVSVYQTEKEKMCLQAWLPYCWDRFSEFSCLLGLSWMAGISFSQQMLFCTWTLLCWLLFFCHNLEDVAIFHCKLNFLIFNVIKLQQNKTISKWTIFTFDLAISWDIWSPLPQFNRIRSQVLQRLGKRVKTEKYFQWFIYLCCA